MESLSGVTYLDKLPFDILLPIVELLKKPEPQLLDTEPNRGEVDFPSIFHSARPKRETDLKRLSLVNKSMRDLALPYLSRCLVWTGDHHSILGALETLERFACILVHVRCVPRLCHGIWLNKCIR
jgi:hypothetical protein